ncbi:hypothetical protein Tco_0024137 [Tanacetum coccineum]
MSRANPQAIIVSEEQLVPRDNRLVIKKNNQRVASDLDITDTMLRFVVGILRHHKLYKPVSLTATVPIIYLHQIWTTINHNANNCTFTFKLDTHTFTLTPGLLRTVLQMKRLKLGHSDYKFRMEIPDIMISDAIKKSEGYNYYIAKKKEMNVLKKDVVPRKARSLTIVEETVVDADKEFNDETNDDDDSDMDLSDDSSQGGEDDARFGVFMHNKSTTTPNSTYPSPTVTSSSLDFIQNLLNETPANELTNFVSNPVYTNAQTTSTVIYPEGNPELTSYILCASEVPLGTHVDVQATNILLQEMFSDENAHHIPSLPAKKISYTATTPHPGSLQAKAKKLMQKAKKNMRKINFKKAVAQKFREYD